MGAHWLIKVFVVLGIKWEMLQECLSWWDCKAKALRAGVKKGYKHLITIPWNKEKYTGGFQGEEWDKCSKDF